MLGTGDAKKIEFIKNMFNKKMITTSFAWSESEKKVYFMIDCGNKTVYFQDNKEGSINANKVTINSFGTTRGVEALKDFYITASDTIDFRNEVELYRGEHTLDSEKNGVYSSEHTFPSRGNYRFYRLYVTSWQTGNGGDGQHIIGCYIE